MNWILNEGNTFLEKINLGENYTEATENQNNLKDFMQANSKVKKKYFLKTLFNFLNFKNMI